MSEVKERPKRLPRQAMPEQEPQKRIYNFDEVPLGYSPELAQNEASRCLGCKKPKCVEGCPVGIDIPGFIQLVKEGNFAAAARKVKEKNALPAVCGRVCPQEEQCEVLCVLKKVDEPVAIGRLERFVADWERASGLIEIPTPPPPTGKKVAIIGSGPAGLTCAAELAKIGHQVTIFEALHEAGGVLVYGIPEFRLPKAILKEEVGYLQQLGVELKTSYVIGKIMTLQEMLESGYDAIFVGTGAGLPKFMGIPGENLLGVYSANEFLTRANLMKAYLWPNYDTPIGRGQTVMVVGGGNVAMDSARTAKRLGAEHAYIVYRRSLDEMPARIEEIHHAEEEGIEFLILHNPVAYLGDEQGKLRAVVVQKQELGEPDESGRRSPVPIAGSEFELPVEVSVVAIGAGANPLISSTTPDLGINKRGYIITDEATGATNIPGVYAGGDIVTGAATVILAMGAGKTAAAAIDEYLRGG